VGRRLKFDGSSLRILVVCGMSGCFSAIFGTPISAAIFAMEVVHVGVMHYSSFFPAIISALVGLQVSVLLGGERTAFTMTGVPPLSVVTVTQVIALGIMLAVLSILYYETLHAASSLYQKYIPNPYLRAAAGGVLVIALTLLVRSYDYNGTGMGVISSALGGYARPEAFALKLLFTAVTLGAGFKGGEIIPVFFSGATFGCVVGPLIGLPASFSAGLGLTALFCGVTNCPVTSVMLAFELFGGGGLPLFVLCSAVSYVLSGYGGLYYEQKIVFSKFKPEYYEEHYKGKIYVP
jgi:H+/Cl- antiporter ClcA